jgi:large subunit ribosomal protein L7/L12
MMAEVLSNEEIIAAIKAKNILEIAELAKALQEEFGVSAMAPAASVAPAAVVAAAVEEQTEFDVILEDVGSQKIQVLKVVREQSGLGLKEAKDLVDSVPKPVKEKVSKEEAAKAKAALEAVGGKVSVK